MFDLILHAIPVFALCLILEAVSYHFLPDDDELGYETRDARTSLAMGLGSVFINLGWKLVVLTAYAAAYVVSPIHLPADNPLTWVALFLRARERSSRAWRRSSPRWRQIATRPRQRFRR